jgi:hypothetical protein
MMMQVGIRQSGAQGQRRVLAVVRSAVRDGLHLRIRPGARRVRSALAVQYPNGLNFQAQAFCREFCCTIPAFPCSGIPAYSLRSGYETRCSTSESKASSNRRTITVESLLQPEGEDDDG